MENLNFLEKLNEKIIKSALKNYNMVAIIQNYSKLGPSYSIEPTREMMLILLFEIQKILFENRMTIKLSTNLLNFDANRIITQANLVVKDEFDKIIIDYSAFGEDFFTSQKGDVTAINEIAIRTAETRALKRVLEMFSPSILTIFKYASEKLNEFVIKSKEPVNMLTLKNYVKTIFLDLFQKYTSKNLEDLENNTREELANNQIHEDNNKNKTENKKVTRELIKTGNETKEKNKKHLTEEQNNINQLNINNLSEDERLLNDLFFQG